VSRDNAEGASDARGSGEADPVRKSLDDYAGVIETLGATVLDGGDIFVVPC
jgi:hypothetical protein